MRFALTASILFLTAIFAEPAAADCQLGGNTVFCIGTDLDGLYLPDYALTVTVVPLATVLNVVSREFFGQCQVDDLSLPAIQVGAGSRVTNNGSVFAAGVCGWGIGVGNNSTVINTGFLGTENDIGFGIAGRSRLAVQNSGTIWTRGGGAPGVLGGNDAQIVNTATGVINTDDSESPAIAVGDRASVTNLGQIRALGRLSHGIDAGANATLSNGGVITLSGQAAVGIRARGGTAMISNAGAINAAFTGTVIPIFDGETRTFIHGAGIDAAGDTLVVSNSGEITVPFAGLQATTARSADVSNSGTITIQGETGREGQPEQGGGGLSAAGAAGSTVRLNNTGKIVSQSVSPGIAANGGAIAIVNSGTITASTTGILAASSQNISITNSGTVTGAIVINGSGAATVSVTNTGRLTGVNGGPAVRTTGAALNFSNAGAIQGDVALGDGGDSLTFLDGSAVSGVIDGGGGANATTLLGNGTLAGALKNMDYLIKGGGGAWAISGSAAVNSQINVLDGALALTPGARLAAPQFNILAAGALTGTGTIAGAIVNAGTIAPGLASGSGTITVEGTLSQSPAAALSFRLRPSGGNDQLVVTGAATMAGRLKLAYVFDPAVRFRDGQVFTVIAPGGPGFTLGGAFSAIDLPDSAFLRPAVTMDSSTGVKVRIARSPYASAAESKSQASVAAILDRLQAAPPSQAAALLNTLDAASGPQARSLFDALAPPIVPAFANMDLLFLRAAQQAQFDRRDPVSDGREYSVWGDVFGQQGDSAGPSPGYDYRLRGGTAGVGLNGENGSLGFTLTYGTGDLTVASTPAAGTFTAFVAGATAAYRWQGLDLQGAVNLGSAANTSTRTQTLSGAAQNLNLKTRTPLASVSSALSKDVIAGPMELTPGLSLTYAVAGLKSTDETSLSSLRTNPSAAKSLRSELFLRAATAIDRLRLFARAGWSQELLGSDLRISAELNGIPGSAFTLIGAKSKRAVADLQAGAAYEFSPGFSIRTAFQGSPNDSLTGFGWNAGIAWRW